MKKKNLFKNLPMRPSSEDTHQARLATPLPAFKFKHWFRGHAIENVADDLILLHHFWLSPTHAGLITISTHDGRKALDVRRFVLTFGADGITKVWRPSVKGLRIPPDEIPNIAEALSRHIKNPENRQAVKL